MASITLPRPVDCLSCRLHLTACACGTASCLEPEGDDSAAVYLNSTGSYTYPDGTGVQAAAFRNADGTRVLVVQNKIRNDLVLQVSFASGDAWHGTVPARSVTTWVLPEPSQAGGDERDCGKT